MRDHSSYPNTALSTAKEQKLSAEDARKLFSYNPATGMLVWLITNSSRARAGTVAGKTPHTSGYMQIAVNGHRYYQHRLIWLIVTGAWPDGEVDHKNGVRNDNRWENLRNVTRTTNQQNQRRPHANSTSGVLGVRAKGRKFAARIQVDGKTTQIGTFDDASSAEAAYLAAKRQHHSGCTI